MNSSRRVGFWYIKPQRPRIPESAKEIAIRGRSASNNETGQATISKQRAAYGHDPALVSAGRDFSVRTVQSEILDRLPPHDPAAQASRRDLRIINLLLGSRGWIENMLRQQRRSGEAVLEIGAGTGELGRSLSSIAPVLAGLDLGRRPAHWPREARWFETDVLQFSSWNDYPVVVANLFFHHFEDADLVRLGEKLSAHARVIVASEPLRSRCSQMLFALLCPFIGAGPVTRHDGRVSITAGFRRDELPRLLKLDPVSWKWWVQETWLGAVRFVAVRRA